MRFRLLLICLGFTFFLQAQIPAYYSSIDFTQTGLDLKEDLSDLIQSTHTYTTSYAEVWDILKNGDLDPTNSSKVLLIYGYNDSDGDVKNDRTRSKDNNGGSVGQWNREHVFPKSLGMPNLGTSGPGADPHNLRASDVQFNGERGNRRFTNGTGNAGAAGSHWYPGDEWKGDVARIVMYMYLRYENRCLPTAVAVGSINSIDGNMVDLLLDWNQSDDVNDFERNRNNEIFAVLGNRNPFIDNPALATQIWGGPQATDTWGGLSVNYNNSVSLSVYPNPVENILTIQSDQPIGQIAIYDAFGRLLINESNATSFFQLPVDQIAPGAYLLQVNGTPTQKILIK